MSTMTLAKSPSTQSRTFSRTPVWLGALALLGTSALFIKMALGIAAFSPLSQPVGYVAQDELSNFNLSSGTETVYRTEYSREFWAGNVFAYPVDSAGSVDTVGERWSGGAQVHIDGQNFDTGRLIATMKDDGTNIPFRTASMSTAQRALLPNTVNGIAYTDVQILNFLRGDRSNEGASALRVRGSALGDIIHTRPYYIPNSLVPTLFIGANDGMIHAINTKVGTERWAYVPSMLLGKMNTLANDPYTHDYFVDGQINIGLVTISAQSKRVLVGGLGGGGKGLYALDVTTLDAATETDVANKILWEITPTKVNYATPTGYGGATGYSNLGYTYGTPVIAKVKNGASIQDVMIIGNGYNDNSTGDYQAYLYVIDIANGQLIRSIKADTAATTDGTAANPNGLSSPIALDTNGDGAADRVYAGDLNGTMWKFDLSSPSTASWTASVLLTTSPAQPITSTPGIAIHPMGGYMVDFGTGDYFTTITAAQISSPTTYYVYGIWDNAPVANTTLVTQTLTERAYTINGTTTRVRRSTANALNWASGGNRGWKVALPAGERIIGDGSFIEAGRFYFNGFNPTVSYLVPSTTTTITGENWLMELNYLTGGSSTLPFLDLDGNLLLNDIDRIKYVSGDTIPTGKVAGDSITSPSEDGIAVGKWLSRGVQSQPLLVQLRTLNTTLFNQNPDVTFPPPTAEKGVIGGHFDVDIYYEGTNTITAGTKATATITVGTTGQTATFPATLGAITVNGIVVTPALTVSDITDGTATGTNATTIKNKVTNGYTATVSGNVVTISAPTAGTASNGMTVDIAVGTSQTLVSASAATSGTKASRTVTFTNGSNISVTGLSIKINGTEIITNGTTGSQSSSGLASWVASHSSHPNYDITASGSTVTITAKTAVASTYDISTLVASSSAVPTAPANGSLVITGVSSRTTSTSIQCGSTFIGTSAAYTSGDVNGASRLAELYTKINGTTVNGYSISCNQSTNPMTCSVTAPVGPSACSSFTLANIATSTNTGPSGGTGLSTTTGTAVAGAPASAAVSKSGWTNFKPALTTTVFSGGTDDTVTHTVSTPCDGSSNRGCSQKQHVHEYDDIYDKTGVNMLDASNTSYDLSRAITATTIPFKVIVQNQYLSPSVKLHIGNPSYVWNIDAGYVPLSGYTTGANTTGVNSGGTLDLASLPTYTRATVGSLVLNMPTTAFNEQDWWNGALGLPKDVRVGLHPTEAGCVMSDAGTQDGNMIQPVIPPADVIVTNASGVLENTADGPGVNGWNNSTTPATATGVRHNGALTVQVISPNTPSSALELSVPSKPQYGWRVKSAYYSTYVLVEYSIYWHTKHLGVCYGETGWSKRPVKDARTCGSNNTTLTRVCATEQSSANGTDPKTGVFGAAITVTSVTTVVVGNVTTITINYSDGGHATVVRTANTDGTLTILTRDKDCVALGVSCAGTTEIIANASGNVISGGDERGMQTRTGRVSWHELIRN